MLLRQTVRASSRWLTATLAVVGAACGSRDLAHADSAEQAGGQGGSWGLTDTARVELVASYLLPASVDGHAPGISALAVGEDGRTYVGTTDGLVHRFDAHGSLEASLRVAQSPEGAPIALAVNARDGLVTRDRAGAVGGGRPPPPTHPKSASAPNQAPADVE